jgi:hypothetical protein
MYQISIFLISKISKSGRILTVDITVHSVTQKKGMRL